MKAIKFILMVVLLGSIPCIFFTEDVEFEKGTWWVGH